MLRTWQKLVFVTDIDVYYQHMDRGTMATIFDEDTSDNDVINIAEEEEDDSDDDKEEETFVVQDFIGFACDIQNRSSKQVGTQEVEKRRFKEFFGTSLLRWSEYSGRCSMRETSSPIKAN